MGRDVGEDPVVEGLPELAGGVDKEAEPEIEEVDVPLVDDVLDDLVQGGPSSSALLLLSLPEGLQGGDGRAALAGLQDKGGEGPDDLVVGGGGVLGVDALGEPLEVVAEEGAEKSRKALHHGAEQWECELGRGQVGGAENNVAFDSLGVHVLCFKSEARRGVVGLPPVGGQGRGARGRQGER